jgi:hypothetical protein
VTFSPFGTGLKCADLLDEENMSTGYANPLGDQSPVKPPGTGTYLLPEADSSASVSTVS